MTLPEFDKGEIPSTSGQAEDLHKAIEALVQDREAPKCSSSIGVTCDNIDTPREVDTHLPPGGTDSYAVVDSAYIQFMLDWKTGEPITDGVVGMVSFSRGDEVVKGVIYAGHVNYHVTHIDGMFGLERHVTNTEHGRHMVIGALGRTARHAVDPAAQLEELLELKARIDESRPTERAMGMFDVSASEAEAVVSFVRDAQQAV